MKLYKSGKNYSLYNGSVLDMLEVIEPNTIDSIVCDPPYELGFMGKSWDSSGIAFQKETWEKCYEVLKSGGYLLAFGGSRTFHRIACAIEDAGFEIRDTIMWLYGSGFPKSMNIGLAIDKKNGVESEVVGIGKSGSADTHTRCMNSITKNGKDVFGGEFEIKKAQNKWNGWGTALKPSFEPIIVARKPCEGSCIDNVLKYDVGGINIDECRIPAKQGEYDIRHYTNEDCFQNLKPKESKFQVEPQPDGRFPANTILTYDETDFDEVCGSMPESDGSKGKPFNKEMYKDEGNIFNRGNYIPYNDNGSAARYFYCAKASKKDREEGCDELNDGLLRRMRPDKDDDNPTGLNKEGRFAPTIRKNTHPTVKPTELMQYLVRLVSPKGATILDCFMGSGSTGKAVMFENKERDANYKFIGIELTEEYLPICAARIEHASKNSEDEDSGQLALEL